MADHASIENPGLKYPLLALLVSSFSLNQRTLSEAKVRAGAKEPLGPKWIEDVGLLYAILDLELCLRLRHWPHGALSASVAHAAAP